MQRGVDVKGCEVNRSGVLRIQMSRALAVSRHALMPGPCRDLQGSVRLKNNTRRVDFTVCGIYTLTSTPQCIHLSLYEDTQHR